MSTTPVTDSISVHLLEELEEARRRTLFLLEPVSDRDLLTQHDPLMSPIVWDLGHIAHFEDLWLNRNLEGPIRFGEMPGLFNPFEHPRADRGRLPLPSPAEVRGLLDRVRERVRDRLEHLSLDEANPLLQDGYVIQMVIQHEYQHNETILQTLQLKQGDPYRAPRLGVLPGPPAISPASGAMVRFPGGPVTIGTDDRSVAYDNERPRHEVDLPPFWIDVAPVRNREYLAFVEDGGYRTRLWWSEEGWRWLRESGAAAPNYWSRMGGEWFVRSMDRVAPVDPERPVAHVCWHEAEAFARWAGRRLPTEAEWEAAASWDPATGAASRYPWGDEPPTPDLANLDQLAFDTAPAGTYAGNVSPIGCYGMIGDLWEWTASDFQGYPGFTSFPYPEYSEVFFGNRYKVLRGGAWATRPGAVRNTFRNWDFPARRQIFAGFRCARDD